MPVKDYSFGFYECDTRSSSPAAAPQATHDILKRLFDVYSSGGNTVKELGGRSFEIRFIEETPYGFRGLIGKHRANDLPHAAIIGGVEREIHLAANENLLEKAQFSFYTDYQLLILQENHFCVGHASLGSFLSTSVYTTSLNPVIEASDLQWMMNGRIQVRTAEIKIARPRNPELFRNLDFDLNNSIMATLNGSGSASLNLSFNGDARSGRPEERYLDPVIKRAIREMQASFDVKKCKLIVENQDTMVSHPVDLVADRLIFRKKINVTGRYPPMAEIWSALLEARFEKEAELVNYFGHPGGQRLA